MNLLLKTVLLFVVAPLSLAQTKNLTLSGLVTDKSNSHVLAGAKITLIGDKAKADTTTDSEGKFIVVLASGVQEGNTARLQVGKTGYRPYDKLLAISSEIPEVISLEPIKNEPTARQSQHTIRTQPLGSGTLHIPVSQQPPVATNKEKDRLEELKKQAIAGNSSAMYQLGLHYESGNGVPLDYEQARKWYEKSATLGDAGAMCNLGGLYLLGNGVEKNYPKARKWFEQSASGGDARAMNNLGWMFYMGYGLPQDILLARQWLEKAVVAGNVSAMSNLGATYAEVEPPDYEQARRWFEKGTAAGDGASMRAIGMMYEQGEGMAIDLKQARSWYEKAVAAGDEPAAERLKKLSK